MRTSLSMRASIRLVNMAGSSSSRQGIDVIAMKVEQTSGGGSPRAPLDDALCWRELKRSFSTQLRTSLSIRASTPHANRVAVVPSRDPSSRIFWSATRDSCPHSEVVFFDGEGGHRRQRVESNGRNGSSVIVALSGASAVAFRRRPWSVIVGATLPY